MFQRRTRRLASVAAAVGLVAAAGCSSASKSGGGVAGAGTRTFTVGVLTDASGPAASGNETVLKGIRAGTVLAARDGYTIKYVLGDTTTTPAGALSAAKKLVEQDHVFAVIAHSALFFAAASYLTQKGIPVIGAAEDGSEWTTSTNMFGVYGATHTEAVSTTFGRFMKDQGATTIGALGYSVSPSSSESAKGSAKSASAVGLNVGYLNAAFPFGSTNVQPIALAMKSKGVDGFYASVDPNTGFSLITALRQVGDNLKVALLPTGYGGDLLQAGPGALQQAQNVYFTLTYEPVEMHTPATEQFQKDLQAVGVTGDPTYAEYNGYLSLGLLVEGLRGAGTKPSQSSLIAALSKIHSWDALGMFGGHNLDINDRSAVGMSNCVWVTKLSGSQFQLVPGADPICGSLLNGVTVSPSS
jgi:ABC-type branched-subunit amino acid transport system substrate-binding protein